MPSIISIPEDNISIGLKEFIEVIDKRTFDFNSDEDVFIMSMLLNRLNNNKSFLLNHLAEELMNVSSFQSSNTHDQKTFILHITKDFILRAVVWLPVSRFKNDKIFNLYHDHNFDLLTVGYFGPGYKTEVFTYDSNEVIGLIGEKVVVESKGIYTLSEGTIMLYKAKKDIHNQIPPDNISVSINVIPRIKAKYPQFEFDKVEFKICRFIQVSSNELITRLVGLLGNENDIDILKKILITNENPHIKAYAALSILQLSPKSIEDIEAFVFNTKNKVIIDLFNQEKMNYLT